jgi:predicted dehydrogenase
MKRRTFLATTLSTLAVTERRPLKIGQIGTEHSHAAGKMQALRSLPHLWEVVGITGPKGYAGVPSMTEAELLAVADLKAVAVETSIADACATAHRCVSAGKHVHLDKPGALDNAAFKAMRLAAEEKGLAVQLGYMLRYNPAFELLFRAVREGWLGDITEIDASMGKLADAKLRRELAVLPGGGMFELACHVIDAVVTVLGKPTSVTAFSTPTGQDAFQDNQTAVLQYAKATAVIRCNHVDAFGAPRRRFCVAGTTGVMEIVPLESGKVNLSLTKPHGGYPSGAQSFQLPVPPGRYDAEFADLAKVVQGEKPLAWTAQHDIAVHETVLRAAGVWQG